MRVSALELCLILQHSHWQAHWMDLTYPVAVVAPTSPLVMDPLDARHSLLPGKDTARIANPSKTQIDGRLIVDG